MTANDSRARAGERGFSLIELLIALAIVVVIGAVTMTQLRGAKQSTYEKEAMTTAAAYDQAIAAFQADNANKLPPHDSFVKLNGTLHAGPKNLLERPYIGKLPDAVLTGRVGVAMSCTNPPSPTSTKARGWISYCPQTAPNYAIRVHVRTNANVWKLKCVRGNTAQTPRCDNARPT